MNNGNEMSAPKVSVVVTAHNGEKYINKCISSILSQTLKQIEIICIDDNSSDNTFNIIESMQRGNDRIRLIKNKKNLGASISRNEGVAASTSKYIMFCDGDDYYEDTICEDLYSAMVADDEVDIAMCEISLSYEDFSDRKYDDDWYYGLNYSGKNIINDELISGIDYSPCNKIFKKEIIEKYKILFPESLYYEDAYFSLAYLSVSKNIFFVNKKLYNYIRHANSIMAKTFESKDEDMRTIDHIYVIEAYYSFLEENNLFPKYSSMFWETFLKYEKSAFGENPSKNKIKVIKSLSNKFISENMDSFKEARPGIKSEIEIINYKHPRFHPTNVKRKLFKLFPTLRLSTLNYFRLQYLIEQNNITLKKISQIKKSIANKK